MIPANSGDLEVVTVYRDELIESLFTTAIVIDSNISFALESESNTELEPALNMKVRLGSDESKGAPDVPLTWVTSWVDFATFSVKDSLGTTNVSNPTDANLDVVTIDILDENGDVPENAKFVIAYESDASNPDLYVVSDNDKITTQLVLGGNGIHFLYVSASTAELEATITLTSVEDSTQQAVMKVQTLALSDAPHARAPHIAFVNIPEAGSEYSFDFNATNFPTGTNIAIGSLDTTDTLYFDNDGAQSDSGIGDLATIGGEAIYLTKSAGISGTARLTATFTDENSNPILNRVGNSITSVAVVNFVEIDSGEIGTTTIGSCAEGNTPAFPVALAKGFPAHSYDAVIKNLVTVSEITVDDTPVTDSAALGIAQKIVYPIAASGEIETESDTVSSKAVLLCATGADYDFDTTLNSVDAKVAIGLHDPVKLTTGSINEVVAALL